MKPLIWRLVRIAHRADFRWFLPWLGKLPLPLAFTLSGWRGRLNAASGRDWRSVALGFRHIRRQSLLAYEEFAGTAGQRQQWCRQRFETESRDEFEAQLLAARRLDELNCTFVPPDLTGLCANRTRGLVLLTPHFDSFYLGIAFLAQASGGRINSMSSAVSHDPRVEPAVSRHFEEKYRSLEHYLNGGKVPDIEDGMRPFYRMLERKETLVVLGDAPVLPNGAELSVNFLGARRLLAGGALRLAEKTGSDIGGFVCRMERPGHYVVEWCEPGPAGDPKTLQRVYDLFNQAIAAAPGRWWGADLLPNMPAIPPPAPVPEMTETTENTPPDYAVMLINNSALSGSDELAYGLRLLQRQWRGSTSQPANWSVYTRETAPAPAILLPAVQARYLLVLLSPALLGTATLPQELADALRAGNAFCALAEENRFTQGEWTPDYSTLLDFERYVSRRRALPCLLPHAGRAHAQPKTYMLDLDRLKNLPELVQMTWDELPSALGSHTMLAARAYVHSYADYQQGARPEMLELLPPDVTRLLDVGGGEGGFARSFAMQRQGEVVLVEPGPVAAQRARESGLQVIEGGIENVDAVQCGLFQAVSFLDVLEHMTDPLAALQSARKLLTPGGVLLLSVPNVGYWPVVRDLMLGRFDYLPVGILCTTHLRFFTADSVTQLLQDAGFELVRLRRHGPPKSEEFARFVQASTSAGLNCDQENLATESLHVVARAH